MVKLRVTARVIPENQYHKYLDSDILTSRNTLPGERKLKVIIRDPDDQCYIGTLALLVAEQYKSYWKHDLGKIKYIKDDEDDCDLDPAQLVKDLLIDEGKLSTDPSDQDVRIKFIQEEGGALRAGSVIPDLTPVHYQPRSRPPVPKFPTQSVLGKRAGIYSSEETPGEHFSWDVKRPRLAEIGETQTEQEDVVVETIETDVPDGSPDFIQESQMLQDSANYPRAPGQEEHQPRPGSAQNLAQDTGNDNGVRSRGPASRQPTEDFLPATNGPSMSKRFALSQTQEASRAPITPPSDGFRKEHSTGNQILSKTSTKTTASAARASSTSSSKFKNHNLVSAETESDVEDSQMSPRSKMKQPFKVPRNISPSSAPSRSVQSVVRGAGGLANNTPRILEEKRRRTKPVQSFSVGNAEVGDDETQGSEVEDEVAESNRLTGDANDIRSSSPAFESGNASRRLFAPGKASSPGPAEGEQIEVDTDTDSDGDESAVQNGWDADSDKENQDSNEQVVAPNVVAQGFRTLHDASQSIKKHVAPLEQAAQAQKMAEDARQMTFMDNLHGSDTVQPLEVSQSGRNSDSAVDDHTTASQRKRRKRDKRRELYRANEKTAEGREARFGVLKKSQMEQQGPTSKTKGTTNPPPVSKKLNSKAKNHSFTLEVRKTTSISPRVTPVLDSPGEQLSDELLASALKPALMQDPQVTNGKPKLKKKQSQLLKEARLEENPTPVAKASKAAENAPESAAKRKPKKAPAREPKDPKDQKVNKKSTTQVPIAATAKATQTVPEVDKAAVRSLEGSMGLGTTGSPRKDKDKPIAVAEPFRGQQTASNSTLKPKPTAKQLAKVTPTEKAKSSAPKKSEPAAITASKQNDTDSVPAVMHAEVPHDPTIGKAPILDSRSEIGSESAPAAYEKAAEISSGKTSVLSSLHKSQSPTVITKPAAKGKSATASEAASVTRPRTKTPSIVSSSRKSLPTDLGINGSRKAMTDTSSSYEELQARANATISRKNPEPVNEVNVTNGEIKSAPLKPSAPPTAPASVTSNPSIKKLHALISKAGQKSTGSSMVRNALAGKKGLALLEAEEDDDDSSSESESEDSDETTSNKKIPVSISTRPDPATRDKSPSSDDDDDDDDDEEL